MILFTPTFSPPRNGTKAARMKDSVPHEVKAKRLRELQAFQLSVQEDLRRPLVGKTFRVLVEKKRKMRGVVKWEGRTNCMRIVHLDHQEEELPCLQWNWVDVEITSSTALSCQEKLLKLLVVNYRRV